jgi:uncharacterized membrane protein
VLILRALDGSAAINSYWSVSLNGQPWLIVALVQLYRMRLGGWMTWVRGALAGIFGLVGLAALVGAALPLSPLGDPWNPVQGPPVLDTLLVAYLLPALILALPLPLMQHLPRWLRLGLGGIATALAALYVGLEIRRAWQGRDLSVPGVLQGELYSYTVALMLVGAGLLALAILRRSAALRWAAMTVIALTIAKVFLLDAAGLVGLMRVVSFLGLGLGLAGVAFLNRWAARHGAA